MQGLGNDFVVLDRITQRFSISPQLIRKLADRHFGIGCDQVLVVEAPDRPDIDFRYRIFNADGGEVEQCGNGARCFARFVRDKKLCGKQQIKVATCSGDIQLTITPKGTVLVDMGQPQLVPSQIPFIANVQASTYPLQVNGVNQLIGAVSMGNPHAVLIVEDCENADVSGIGAAIENHPRFPERVNVGFMQIIDRSNIRLRVFERGVGETLACGTGACAAVVSGILRGELDNKVSATLNGGHLSISWEGGTAPVMMDGPAFSVFDGQILT
jgi:diaminopimelate epimerase